MKKTTEILLWSALGAVLIGTSIFVVFKIRKKKFGKSRFRRKAVAIAIKEWKDWNEGKIKEKESIIYSKLRKYWNSVGWGVSEWTPSSVAWSAAFISYVMKSASAKGEFNYNSLHSSYIIEAVKNRKSKSKNPFKAYKLNEKKAEIGDLVCYARQDGVTYDTTSDYKSHCDIIVGIDNDSAIVIGGNVGDSVTKKNVPLTKSGYVSDGGKRFTLIKTM